ncbi:hypothetical protein CANARDRAFT_176548 [[Candida] arabinofermentans NRRL YB-2248]|uniref:Peroxisomal membrane protein 4 n=1 Tax=[Candida] arabinofermentans NRRL YB-2248 TaxID=983967 RepID=A0A1E4SYZ0_9ASCO|nr:hypothetical protein CANARDRAFT_176548 [[Candida] arabinofermentans NRRL YB-2248]
MSDADSVVQQSTDVLIQEICKTILNASKNAMIYGYRVRFIHSISIQLLSIDKSQKLYKQIVLKLWKAFKLGIDHGKILSSFAIIYKLMLITLTKLTDNNNNKQSNINIKHLNNFISGFIGGFIVYGGFINKRKPGMLNDAILKQITLYCLSRVALGLGKFIVKQITKKLITFKRKAAEGRHSSNYHEMKIMFNKVESYGRLLSSGLIWGSVMMFYSIDKNFLLQKSLKLSLDFIYGDSIYSWMEAFNYSR